MLQRIPAILDELEMTNGQTKQATNIMMLQHLRAQHAQRDVACEID